MPDFELAAVKPLGRRRLRMELGLRLRVRARFSTSESDSCSSEIAFEEGARFAAERVMGAK